LIDSLPPNRKKFRVKTRNFFFACAGIYIDDIEIYKDRFVRKKVKEVEECY